ADGVLLEPMRQRLEGLDAAHDAFESGTGGERDLRREAGVVEVVLAPELAALHGSNEAVVDEGGDRRQQARTVAQGFEDQRIVARALAQSDGKGRVAIDEVELVGVVA